MKVCIINPRTLHSIGESRPIYIVNSIYNSGHQVDMHALTPVDDNTSLYSVEAFEPGINQHLTPFSLQPRFLKNPVLRFVSNNLQISIDQLPEPLAAISLGFLKAAENDIKRSDIVFIENPGIIGLILTLFVRFYRKPIILDAQGSITFSCIRSFKNSKLIWKMINIVRLMFTWLVEKLMYTFSSTIIICDEDEKDFIVNTLNISPNKIKVVPNGVDCDLFYPRQTSKRMIREKYGLSDNDFVILFVGNLKGLVNYNAVKYIEENLKPYLLELDDTCRFVIVGPYPLDFPYISDDYIQYVGQIKHLSHDEDDVMDFINAADICISPVTMGGGTKIKVLEYLACGKVVVSTPESAYGIQIEDGQNILISNLEDFLNTILSLKTNGDKIEEIGKNARVLIKEKYDWKTIVQNVNQVLLNLI